MTFSKILKSSSFGVALILMLSFVVLGQQSRSSTKYKNPYVEGLYYVESSDNSDERELAITFDGKPIPPKSNDPEAPTITGFYLSRSKRVAFQKVEISGKKVYFKTRSISGISYEFRGTIGEEINSDFDSSQLLPFIKGTMTKFKRGKIVKTEKIKFGRAVIA